MFSVVGVTSKVGTAITSVLLMLGIYWLLINPLKMWQSSGILEQQ